MNAGSTQICMLVACVLCMHVVWSGMYAGCMPMRAVIRLLGEQVNLREQHDALEFFNSLVDSLDEALNALNYKPIITKVLGGSFADQKICKGCPHRSVS